MLAIEFQTTIRHGMIEVPQQYLPQLTRHAKVILLMEETPHKQGVLEQLLHHPLHDTHFTPLTREEIYER